MTEEEKSRTGFDDPQDLVDIRKPGAKGNVNLGDLDLEENDDTGRPDKNKDDEDDELDDEGGEVDLRHSTQGIPISEFNELRSRKRALDEELRKAQVRIAELEKQVPEPGISDEEVRAAALELTSIPSDATEEEKQGLLRKTEFQIRSLGKLFRPSRRASASDIRELSELKEVILDIRDQQTFDQEWNETADQLSDSYPRASQRQWREARQAMDDLAHAPQFADKDQEYVYFKNKDIFDEILGTTRRKTFESRESRPGAPGEEIEETPFDVKKLPPEKLLKLKEKLDQEARDEDQRSGWNVKNPATF